MIQTFVFENLIGKFIISKSLISAVKGMIVILFSVLVTGVCYGIVKLLRRNSYTNRILPGTYKQNKTNI